MPVTLAELSGATTPPPPRFNKPQVNKSFSVIEDVFSVAPPSAYGVERIPTIGTNGYTSDDIVSGNGVPTRGDFKSRNKVPQDWVEFNSTTNFNPRLANQFKNEPMRSESEAQAERIMNQNYYPTAPQVMGPQVAGVTPGLKNAVGDATIPMGPMVPVPVPQVKSKEGFHSRRMDGGHTYGGPQGGQTCIETLNHIMNCPMCQKYFECDTKIYNVIIIMLILLFTTIIFFLYKEDKKR